MKLDSERQISYDIIYICGILKKKMNFFAEKHRLTGFEKLVVTKGDRLGLSGRDRLGIWDWQYAH